MESPHAPPDRARSASLGEFAAALTGLQTAMISGLGSPFVRRLAQRPVPVASIEREALGCNGAVAAGQDRAFEPGKPSPKAIELAVEGQQIAAGPIDPGKR